MKTGNGGSSRMMLRVDTATHFADGGLTYLISDDFQLDARIATGLGGNETDLIVGVGFAYRW